MLMNTDCMCALVQPRHLPMALLQVKHMQTRENAADTDFEGILEEEVAADLKEIATISMGTEISAEDMSNITALCDQVWRY